MRKSSDQPAFHKSKFWPFTFQRCGSPTARVSCAGRRTGPFVGDGENGCDGAVDGGALGDDDCKTDEVSICRPEGKKDGDAVGCAVGSNAMISSLRILMPPVLCSSWLS